MKTEPTVANGGPRFGRTFEIVSEKAGFDVVRTPLKTKRKRLNMRKDG